MATHFTVQHVEHVSSNAFEKVIAAFEGATGDISDGRFGRELAASRDVEDFERRIREFESTSGFMRFLMLDHGAWSALYGDSLKSRVYTLGNPLIAHTMLKHDTRVGLNVPVRVLIFEVGPGDVRFGYDLPSSLMSGLENADVTTAAHALDEKLAALAALSVGTQA